MVQIADLLGRGQENAMPRAQLRALTGLEDRELRQRIERERRSGIPILSDNQNGYYLPASEAERARCVRSLRARAREIAATADAIAGAVMD